MITAIMALTFGVLIYFQILYLENMVKMREQQFTEGVMRSLSATSDYLEREETLHFLEQDIKVIESSFYDNFIGNSTQSPDIKYSVENPDGSVTNFTLSSKVDNTHLDPSKILKNSTTQDPGERYRNMQDIIRSQYLYQKGLLNEVILSILRDSGSRPVMERADSTKVRTCLRTQLSNNGVNVPFAFAIFNINGTPVYSSDGFTGNEPKDIYSIPLFSNSEKFYTLKVEFPTKKDYIFSSVRFIIPTIAMTIILFVIFLYTIILIFRQKKLSEMKTDFINNMTHELKTPISTISLAGQMLSDPAIVKSQSTLQHLAEVVTDESKRLRFQVEKVLQMSIFDQTGGALKFAPLDANEVIASIARTFKIKVEKYGGSLTTSLEASRSGVEVDEMQFTNVIFNLLDNAVKYMDPEREPRLHITTRDISGDRLEIRIRDNGIGIKKDDLKRIFDKFYRVSTGNLHNVKGFGLGLAYVKKMITLFHGNITAESEYGKGSEFIITLPLQES